MIENDNTTMQLQIPMLRGCISYLRYDVTNNLYAAAGSCHMTKILHHS